MSWEHEKDTLLESQKTRDSLMKWKLIIIATVGAASLGFSGSAPLPHSEFALCLIPFACCYIDLLCRNLSIRTKMIGKFLAKNEDPLELFYLAFKGEEYDDSKKTKHEDGKKVRSLESLAMRGSTIFVSVVIVPIGATIYLLGETNINYYLIFPVLLFVISGICGILISNKIEKHYLKQRSKIYSIQSHSPNGN